jgi:hypothetical protein
MGVFGISPTPIFGFAVRADHDQSAEIISADRYKGRPQPYTSILATLVFITLIIIYLQFVTIVAPVECQLCYPANCPVSCNKMFAS